MGWRAVSLGSFGPLRPRQLLCSLTLFVSGLMAVGASAGGQEANTYAAELYQHNCYTCHSTGLPGAPQLGVVEDWVTRFGAGREALYENALEGFIGKSDMLMPPRGGNAALTDAEVMQVVDYMLKASGLGDPPK